MATSATALHPTNVPIAAGSMMLAPAPPAIAISIAVSIAPVSVDTAMIVGADVLVDSAMTILLGVQMHHRADSHSFVRFVSRLSEEGDVTQSQRSREHAIVSRDASRIILYA